MSKDPAFLFYPADAAQDVSHMNRLERGCYFDLIQAQKKFGRLSEELIKKVLGHDFDICWESVKICLTYVDHMYFIEWLEESIDKRKKYCESRKDNKNSKKDDHMTNICETHDYTYVEHMVNENENVNIIKKEDKNLLFESFWNVYPKKKDKGHALKAWYKISKPKETLGLILKALEWQNESLDWKKENGQYIPMPSTYLNGRRWEDERQQPQQQSLTILNCHIPFDGAALRRAKEADDLLYEEELRLAKERDGA